MCHTSFVGGDFEYLEIDPKHVNKEKRSNYSTGEVVKIVTGMINNLRLDPYDIDIKKLLDLTYLVEE